MSASVKDSLFEDLLGHTELDYLSDLHRQECFSEIHAALLSLEAAKYSGEEWRQLAEYITGKTCPAANPEAVRNDLLEYTKD